MQKILRSSKQLTCIGKCIHGNNRFRPIIWYYRGHRLIESTFFSDRLIPIYFSSILRWLKSAENYYPTLNIHGQIVVIVFSIAFVHVFSYNSYLFQMVLPKGFGALKARRLLKV
jgi:hypothetical protein